MNLLPLPLKKTGASFIIRSLYEVTVKRNLFKLFINKLMAYPLWVKQAVYYRLYQNMRENYCERYIVKNIDNIFSMHIPTLTFQGKNELWDRAGGLDSNIYNFLKFVHSEYTILEISLNMFLSIEEVAKYYIFCLEQNYIEAPEADEIYAMAGFISGKFPTGDYFLKNGSITVDQLDVALAEQHRLSERGQHELIGKILIRLGFITEESVKTLFRLKADARKRFVLNPEVFPSGEQVKSDIKKLEDEVKALKAENNTLKQTLGKIIEMVKKYDD